MTELERKVRVEGHHLSCPYQSHYWKWGSKR